MYCSSMPLFYGILWSYGPYLRKAILLQTCSVSCTKSSPSKVFKSILLCKLKLSVPSLTCRTQNYNQRSSFTEPSVFISILPWRSSGSGLLSGQPFFSLEWNAMNKNVFPEAVCRVTSNTGEFPVKRGIKGSGWKFYRPTWNKSHSLFFNVLGHWQLTLDLLVL